MLIRTNPFGNRLLASLPLETSRHLVSLMEEVEMPLRKVLAGPGQPLSYVYFPNSGMVSLVSRLADGAAIETGLIGSEGFVGVPILLGTLATPIEVMVQGRGHAYRMAASCFLREVERSPLFRKTLLKFVAALQTQLAQTAACNGRHTLQERLSRWLLEAHDRIDSPELILSHELLSMMLGSRRSGITEAMGELKACAVVETGHNRVVIKDRAALERVACECYGTVKQEFERLLLEPAQICTGPATVPAA